MNGETPRRPHSIARWISAAALLALITWSFELAGGLSDALSPTGLEQMAIFLRGLWPPKAPADFLATTVRAMIETLAISIAGCALSLIIAGAILPFAARPPGHDELEPTAATSGRWAGLFLARSLLSVLRTIPELVWAIIWVFVVGLGPLAGALALGIHNGGVLGKLWADSIENVPSAPASAIRAIGASPRNTFLWGALPLAAPQLIAYALYRWEVSIRAASILGFVGAGGLGREVHVAISLFLEGRLLTLIGAIFALVTFVDLLSSWLRRKLEARF